MAASGSDVEAGLAARSLSGDRAALEELVKVLQPSVYKLAQRFLYCPEEAEDATQDILMKIITHLSSFKGESRFTTWAYAIAANYLRDLKRRSKIQEMSFEEFSEDLASGLADQEYEGPDKEILEKEVLIGCTTAMLQCLDDDARLAYTLGEIMELDHNEAAEIAGCSASTYRKRLSRARNRVGQFMVDHCGLVEGANRCRCSKRVVSALNVGRVSREVAYFHSPDGNSQGVGDIVHEIRSLERKQRAAALFKIQYSEASHESFTNWLKSIL